MTKKTHKDQIDLSRLLIESLIKKSIKNLKTDPHRSLRTLVEFGQEYARESKQKEFFNVCSYMLENEESGYYSLLENAVAFGKEENIMDFGINIGYEGLIKGVSRAKGYEAQLGFLLPWMTYFYQEEDSVIEFDEEFYTRTIDFLIKRGTHFYFMDFNHPDMKKILSLAKKFKKASFLILLKPEDLTPEVISLLDKASNVLVSIETGSTEENEMLLPLFAKLRKKKILYSVHRHFGEDTSEEIEKFDWITPIMEGGFLFCLLIPDASLTEEKKKKLHEKVSRSRLEQVHPFILFDVPGDASYVGNWLKGGESTVYINEKGECIRHFGEEPFLKILETPLT